eukprot:560626-Amphidinium_carterae.1
MGGRCRGTAQHTTERECARYHRLRVQPSSINQKKRGGGKGGGNLHFYDGKGSAKFVGKTCFILLDGALEDEVWNAVTITVG